jgi:hypothetical protein
MTQDDRRVAREAKAMTRQEVIMKAVEGRITWIADLQRDGTPPLQKHSPLGPHRRDVTYLPFFSVRCPAFCPGLSLARYDSPSMTRS